jgi:hypothetical protein
LCYTINRIALGSLYIGCYRTTLICAVHCASSDSVAKRKAIDR